MSLNDHLYYSRAIKSIQNEELIKGSDLINIIKDLSRLRDIVDGLSGGGAITANHGNTVYVSQAGDNGTGELGNISKPFETVDAAIAAFNAANPATLVILSSSAPQVIDAYDYSTNPYDLSIQVLGPVELTLGNTGSCSFGKLFLKSAWDVNVNTQLIFATDASMDVTCNVFRLEDTSNGVFEFTGTLNCNYFFVEDNANINIDLDTVVWNTGMSIGVISGVAYNKINPWKYSAVLNQTSTNAPVAVVNTNTLGEVLTYGYNNPGDFTITSPGNKFIAGRTEVTYGHGFWDGVALAIIGQVSSPSTGTINFGSYSPNGVVLANDLLVDTTIKIEIYPDKY